MTTTAEYSAQIAALREAAIQNARALAAEEGCVLYVYVRGQHYLVERERKTTLFGTLIATVLPDGTE